MKRILPLLLLLSLLLSGCAEAPVEPDDGFLMAGDLEISQQEPPIRVASFTLPIHSTQTLDPITCSDGLQRNVSALLYEGLFTLNPSFEAEYCLCDSYEYDPDRFVYTFHIREGVTFSDGTALTARDVVATYNRARESVRYASRFTNVTSMRYQGTDTVRIALNKADAAFPALLDIPIVRRGTESKPVPVGTGPYLYITEGTQDYLKANTSWWRGNIQPLIRMELSPVKDEDTAAYRFSSAEVQLLCTDLLSGGSLNATTSITVTPADTTDLLYLGFRTTGLFADAELRRAVSLGIDREALVGGYLSGYARTACFPISPVSARYPKELETHYELSAYTDALAALGYGEDGEQKERSATLLVSSENAEKVAIAEAIAANLTQPRLAVKVRALPWEQYLTALQNGKFDLYLAEVRLNATWDPSALIATGGGLNYGYYSDPQTDLLIDQFRAAGAEDKTTVDALYDHLLQQAPIVPICFGVDSVLTQTPVLDRLTPTATNPFYGLEHWQVTLSN